MAGQRIDREDRYENTGLTVQARNAQIIKLHKQGWTERAIAKHFGIAPSNAHYIIAAAAGKPRNQAKYGMCEGCWEDFPASQLDKNEHCTDCRG